MNYKFINTSINEYTFVDLGLPSGNLWAVENTITEFNFCDYFKTHAERISKADIFPEYFPSGADYSELLEHCKYEFKLLTKHVLFLIGGKITHYFPHVQEKRQKYEEKSKRS